MKKSLLALIGLLALGVSSGQAVNWFNDRISIGGGYGMIDPFDPDSFDDAYEKGPLWTVNAKYFLSERFSLVGSYANMTPHLDGNKLDTYKFRPIVGSLRMNLFHNLPVTPYLTGGAGYSFNKHEIPNTPSTEWDGFTYQGGAGLEFFLTDSTSFGVEALYHFFEPDGNNHPYRLFSGVGLVNLYFGNSPAKKRSEDDLARERAATQQAEQAKLQAEQGKLQAEQQAATATAAAAAATAAAASTQAQLDQAQAEINKVKELIANKEISPITFKTGSAELAATSNPTLDKVSTIIQKYPNLKVRVEGHTDNTGSDATNQTLSQRRADAVRDYLTNTGGVATERVSSVGFGETRPVAPNETSDGRLQNRRVEFIFTL